VYIYLYIIPFKIKKLILLVRHIAHLVSHSKKWHLKYDANSIFLATITLRASVDFRDILARFKIQLAGRKCSILCRV